MKFRPCIDIHNGKVKQIVGGSLRDSGATGRGSAAPENASGLAEGNSAAPGSTASENFVSEKSAAWYAEFYREKNLTGGHVILLNPAGSAEYEATLTQAKSALSAWPGGLQIGGGITAENAEMFLEAGASHVIVTSYVFRGGRIDRERLERLVHAVGREHLVLDLSCRKKQEKFYVVTDRWQTFTEECVTPELLQELGNSCDEFLIHAADVEGKKAGIEEELIAILAEGTRIPTTYAGGIGSLEDIKKIREAGAGRLDFTVGSALDLFGGGLALEDVLKAQDAPGKMPGAARSNIQEN